MTDQEAQRTASPPRGQNEAEQGQLQTQGKDEDATRAQQPDQRGTAADNDRPYTYFRERDKLVIILTASFLALISPISASIYLPAINTISQDLHVSITLMNLTITTYMVC